MRLQLIAGLLICVYLLSLGESVSAQQKLVDIYVSVENSDAQLIAALDSKYFRVFENGKPQEIKLFAGQDEPVSIGFLFDLSASMTHNEMNSKIDRVEWCRQAVLDFLQTRKGDDEYLFMTFGQRVEFLSDFIDGDEVAKMVGEATNFFRPKKNNTALNDAMIVAIRKLSGATNERRVLIVFSDGEDNSSAQRHTAVDTLLKRNNVIVYVLATHDPAGGLSWAGSRGLPGIADVADDSGGRFFYSDSRSMTRKLVIRVASILQSQYHLGFVSQNQDAPDKWRKLEVKLEFSKSESKLIGSTRLKYRKGYFPLAGTPSDN